MVTQDEDFGVGEVEGSPSARSQSSSPSSGRLHQNAPACPLLMETKDQGVSELGGTLETTQSTPVSRMKRLDALRAVVTCAKSGEGRDSDAGS